MSHTATGTLQPWGAAAGNSSYSVMCQAGIHANMGSMRTVASVYDDSIQCNSGSVILTPTGE
ncbi:MAG: hypothetical protein RLY58_2442 [Pseudomonadota bacterium]|jgi:hypothetical protein